MNWRSEIFLKLPKFYLTFGQELSLMVILLIAKPSHKAKSLYHQYLMKSEFLIMSGKQGTPCKLWSAKMRPNVSIFRQIGWEFFPIVSFLYQSFMNTNQIDQLQSNHPCMSTTERSSSLSSLPRGFSWRNLQWRGKNTMNCHLIFTVLQCRKSWQKAYVSFARDIG